MEINNYRTYNILHMIDEEKAGDIDLNQVISSFSCEKNKDVEMFLKKNARNFALQKIAVTYFVIEESTYRFLGYFTITIKPIVIVQDVFDNFNLKVRRKIKRVAKYDASTNSYSLCAYLIAQFGKNDSIQDNPISGNDLMDIAISKLQETQERVGGTVIFVESVNNEKVIDFYKKYGFFEFVIDNGKASSSDDRDLVQMVTVF